ncbi:carbohydrate-binding domain-containing protein [Allobaculum sp. JKK-2023]|uniref:carbohydrate-binding domain-containing protein n=1 Tax=Allobaculum sp. JKK-2023 TaxID=3108943 RepID=UPI002B05CE70|nr:carbohydrate-binding domain-containing protein [Allobaculum sp. JKK-2023]
MNLNRKHFALSAMMAAVLALTGCSTAQAPVENQASETKQAVVKDKNAQSDKTQTTKTETEDKNDDVELDNLTAVEGTTISLSDAKSNLLINKGGTYTLKGKTNYTIVVDAKDQDVTLILDSATIDAKDLPAIYVRNAKKTVVDVTGSSSLSSTSHTAQDGLNAALYVCSDLDLKGSGTLTITDPNGHGIKAKGDITSRSVTIKVQSGQDGIHASDNLTINSGTYSFTADDEGIEVNEALTINNGTFTVNSKGDGLRAETGVAIKNGTYTITTENEGIESKADLTIENGTFTINATDDGSNAGNDLTVKGGTLNVVSTSNDGLDANSNLNLEGGTINVTALKTPEGAFDEDNAKFKISGGTIVGLSAMATLPTDVTQNTVMINASSSFKKLELKQGGKTILTFSNPSSSTTTSNKTSEATQTTSNDQTGNSSESTDSANKDNFQNTKPEMRQGGMPGANASTAVLTLSCKDLKAGSEAELYLDGELAETFTVEEGLTQVGNIQTMGGGMPAGDFGGRGGQMPGNFENGQRPEMPEDFDFGNGERPQMPEDFENENSRKQKSGRSNKGGQNNQNTQEDTTSSATKTTAAL